MRISIYYLYCITNNNISKNSKNYIIDHDGSMLSDFDIWCLPCLLILQPEITKKIMYSRYK